MEIIGEFKYCFAIIMIGYIRSEDCMDSHGGEWWFNTSREASSGVTGVISSKCVSTY